jgi:hypothetical protein
MADRLFTLDWRLRTKRNETLTRGQLNTIDARVSTRKRLRIPSPLPPLQSPNDSSEEMISEESLQPASVAKASSKALPTPASSQPSL